MSSTASSLTDFHIVTLEHKHVCEYVCLMKQLALIWKIKVLKVKRSKVCNCYFNNIINLKGYFFFFLQCRSLPFVDIAKTGRFLMAETNLTSWGCF
jgi:hypothetical protein